MPENNLRQADVPTGASIIPQMPGTAPGPICPDRATRWSTQCRACPTRWRRWSAGTVLPDLERRAGITGVIKSRTLRTWGDSESGLAEKLHDEFDRLEREGGCTIAFLASGMEGIKVRITAKAPKPMTAVDAILARRRGHRVRDIIGPVVFGVDDDTMESVVLDLLKRAGPHAWGSPSRSPAA